MDIKSAQSMVCGSTLPEGCHHEPPPFCCSVRKPVLDLEAQLGKKNMKAVHASWRHAHDQLSLWPYRMSSSQQRSTERKVQQCRACSSFASWDKIYCFLAQDRELDWSWHAWVRLSGSDSAKTEWWEMILDLCSHLVIGFQCKTSQKYSRRRSPIYFRPR